MKSKDYTNWDYEQLCQLYFENTWLRKCVNHEGFEHLWYDYNSKREKLIIRNLLNNFKYLTLEEAEDLSKSQVCEISSSWGLDPHNTLFIGFARHKYADGSQVFLNFLKGILVDNNPGWKEQNLLPKFSDGIARIKAGGFPRSGLILENIVLVDDFVGSGGTAYKNLLEIKNLIKNLDANYNLYFFSLASMKGAKKVIQPLSVPFVSCIFLNKGTTLSYPPKYRSKMKKEIKRMERILHNGDEKKKLKDHSLGWKQSETLYSCTRFNLPNNNYPIFWWNMYRNGKHRKTMFNRMQ
ncbi:MULTISPECIES: phosphoribosyltransferase-like protein [unclassified Robiginitalea]|uniref:phosphoribosyltransferase-like protein n=1 Tax=Robiginitalea TaxID=252306 RepID=UPI00234AA627|nr:MULTISPECIES: hypothetical protein [unclassified Robiginitalea]MDC6353281.1 hypothetical protein [Robiginitalea sp. PM2]MDC6373553.1 hypothetical protein [Robiginitalea sp. SP8]